MGAEQPHTETEETHPEDGGRVLQAAMRDISNAYARRVLAGLDVAGFDVAAAPDPLNGNPEVAPHG